MKVGQSVHCGCNLAPVVSAFLKRSSNKSLAEVTASRVNRGAGYGLEIPCKYHFYGSSLYIERLKTMVEKQRSDGLLDLTSIYDFCANAVIRKRAELARRREVRQHHVITIIA